MKSSFGMRDIIDIFKKKKKSKIQIDKTSISLRSLSFTLNNIKKSN